MPDVQIEPTAQGLRLFTDHGQLFLSVSDGKAVIHDLEGDGEDGATITSLGNACDKLLSDAGFDEVFVHVSSENQRLLDLYYKRWGFTPAYVILRKELSPHPQK